MQRTVAAAGAPRATTTGASSVFGLAAGRPRGRATPLDPEKIEILKGVPVPPVTTGPGSGNRALTLLKRMKKGDSVVLSAQHSRSVKAAATKAKIVVAVRRLDAERFGVWRLE